MSSTLPPSASIATPLEGEKLHAPSADRNVDALCEMLREHAPHTGNALEIASGTGQHVVRFADTLPDLLWHPSEVDPTRRASIDAYTDGLPNIIPALDLDATMPGWSVVHPDYDLIFLSNLLHLIKTIRARILVAEAALALAPGGTLILYGPFKRNGVLTSDGDARFDADLRGADPDIGYKDDLDILAWLEQAGLSSTQIIAMPANNLAFIARKVS